MNYDDREDLSAGEKLKDADLLGMPTRVIVSEKTLGKKSVEVKERGKDKSGDVKIKDAIKFLISKS